MIFHVSHDSVTKEGEIVEERDARLAKNVDCQHHYDVEASREADEDGPNYQPIRRTGGSGWISRHARGASGGAWLHCHAPRADRGGQIYRHARGANREGWLCCRTLGGKGDEPLYPGAGGRLKTVLPKRIGARI